MKAHALIRQDPNIVNTVKLKGLLQQNLKLHEYSSLIKFKCTAKIFYEGISIEGSIISYAVDETHTAFTIREISGETSTLKIPNTSLDKLNFIDSDEFDKIQETLTTDAGYSYKIKLKAPQITCFSVIMPIAHSSKWQMAHVYYDKSGSFTTMSEKIDHGISDAENSSLDGYVMYLSYVKAMNNIRQNYGKPCNIDFVPGFYEDWMGPNNRGYAGVDSRKLMKNFEKANDLHDLVFISTTNESMSHDGIKLAKFLCHDNLGQCMDPDAHYNGPRKTLPAPPNLFAMKI